MRSLLQPLILLALLVPQLLSATPVSALESTVFQSPRDRVSLISSADRYQPGKPLTIALRFRTQPAWNIYWHNPGDAGTPPRLKLTVSGGGSAGPIQWPTPARQPEDGIMTYGYTGEAVLPLDITTGSAGGKLTLSAHASWLICQRICVPEKADFTLTLPEGPATPSLEAPLIAAALARQPGPSPFTATITPQPTLLLSGDGLSPRTVQDAWFFPDQWGPIDMSAPQRLKVAPGQVELTLTKGSNWTADTPLSGVLVLRDPMGGESNLAITASPAVAPTAALGWGLLLSAFAGGLILNLMPCVFPILAMKAMALARMGGARRAEVRSEAGFYTLGVIISFAALGGVLALARALGGDQGWGFQFQQPIFVALMAALMLAVALNLLGVFEFSARFWTPHQSGKVGSFLTGLLAVLLATPCTAPFMAVAIAAALQAPAPKAALIFVSLGLGMAAPYALLALAPGLAKFLPRPGAWMGLLRRVLALPMLAAMIWLIWVESEQVSPVGLAFAIILLAALALGLLALRRFQHGGSAAHLTRDTGLAAIFIAFTLLQIASHPATRAPDQATSFSEARLASLRAAGTPVFVDMTAAWCVTCLVNERVALEPDRIKQAFAARNIAYLKGDWTTQNPQITEFLRAHGRDGVPLYVFYPPRNGTPVVLPQILTPSLVLNQIGETKF